MRMRVRVSHGAIPPPIPPALETAREARAGWSG